MKLESHELKLASKLFDLAVLNFEDHFPNDFDETWFGGWTDDQKQDFFRKVDLIDSSSGIFGGYYIVNQPSWYIMALFREIFIKMAEEMAEVEDKKKARTVFKKGKVVMLRNQQTVVLCTDKTEDRESIIFGGTVVGCNKGSVHDVGDHLANWLKNSFEIVPAGSKIPEQLGQI